MSKEEKEKIEELFLEFDTHETPEALFAYQCDKLECDIQSKLYDQNFMAVSHYVKENVIDEPFSKKLKVDNN